MELGLRFELETNRRKCNIIWNVLSSIFMVTQVLQSQAGRCHSDCGRLADHTDGPAQGGEAGEGKQGQVWRRGKTEIYVLLLVRLSLSLPGGLQPLPGWM